MDKMSCYKEKAVSYSHGKIICKSIYGLLIYIQILFVLFYRLFLQYGVPSGISYLTDVINVILLLGIIKSNKRMGKVRKLVFVYIALFVWGWFGALMYGLSVPLFLWSMRNNARYIVFVVACAYYLKIEDFESMLTFLQKLMPLETIFVAVQFFIYHYRGDYLGGIFGTVMGANLYTNLYMIFVVSYTMMRFLTGKDSLRKLVTIMIQVIGVAVLAELKFVFVEIIIIFGIAWLISKKDAKQIGKTIFIIVGGYIVISASLMYFNKIYPDFENFLRLEFIFAVHEQGYSMSGDLDRLSAIPIITNKIFRNDITKILFGVGFGNAEYSSIRFLCSDFYNTYGYLHYTWFSDAMIYLESGLVGLIIYILSFIVIIFEAMKNYIGKKGNIELYGTVVIICIMSIILMIYNQTLRTEAAYLIYFVVAAAFVKRDKERTVLESYNE